MEEYLAKGSMLLAKYSYLKTILYSVLLYLFYRVARFIAHTNIEKKKIDRTDKIFFKKKSQEYLRYFFLAVLFVLWFAQLQIFIVSLFAIAAAIVLAFKELIMCVTGGILVKTAGTFKAGHRIDIGTVRGFVLEKNLLTTRVLEIGPEKNSQQTTGDVVTIPNSMMLTQALKNESYFKGYSIKSFLYRSPYAKDSDSLEKLVLSEAKKICGDYVEDAKKHISRFCEKEGIVIPSIEPRSKVIVEDDKLYILVKLPVLNTAIAEVEQKLNRVYLSWLKKVEIIDAP